MLDFAMSNNNKIDMAMVKQILDYEEEYHGTEDGIQSQTCIKLQLQQAVAELDTVKIRKNDGDEHYLKVLKFFLEPVLRYSEHEVKCSQLTQNLHVGVVSWHFFYYYRSEPNTKVTLPSESPLSSTKWKRYCFFVG